MGHIHTGVGEHDLTVGAYIFRIDGKEPRLLLHLHKKLGKWLQFGGHVELIENPWQAIEHEILEESGYELSQLRLLQPQDRITHLTGAVLHPQPFNVNTHPFDDTHNHTVLEYAFVTNEGPASKVGDGESETCRLFTREEIMQIPEDEVFPDTKEICLYLFDVCLPGWEQAPTTS